MFKDFLICNEENLSHGDLIFEFKFSENMSLPYCALHIHFASNGRLYDFSENSENNRADDRLTKLHVFEFRENLLLPLAN